MHAVQPAESGRSAFSAPHVESLAGRAETINKSRVKRTLDGVGAALLIVSLVLVFLVVGLAVAVDSRGRVFSRQQRYGRGKSIFWLYEFRTIRSGKAAGAESVTRVGTFLLRSGLHALPQLLNVLRGDMSFVGPRSRPVAIDDHGLTCIPNYVDRHLVRPGLSAAAQISAHQNLLHAQYAAVESLRQDRLYIQNWSLWLDLKVLARALRCLISPDPLHLDS
jgi:putative colanic acid biosysnthesis UDP-glucose lipid carrier transferase